MRYEEILNNIKGVPSSLPSQPTTQVASTIPEALSDEGHSPVPQQQQLYVPEVNTLTDDQYLTGAIASNQIAGDSPISPVDASSAAYPERMREIAEKNPELTPYELYAQTFQRPELRKDDEKKLKAQRGLAAFADIAQLIGEGVTGSAGSDINKREGTATGVVAQRQQNLYDEYRKRQKEYDLGGYQAKLQGIRQSREDKAREEQLAYKRWKDGLDMSRWSAEMKIKAGELDRKVRAGELSAKQAQDKLKETARHNKAMEGIGWTNAKTSRMNAENKEKGKDDKFKGTFSVIENGERKNLRFKDQDFFNATALEAAGMMRNEAVAKGDTATIDEINLIYNSPESIQQAISYVSQNINKYPEVLDYVVSQSENNGRIQNSGTALGLGIGSNKSLGLGIGKTK